MAAACAPSAPERSEGASVAASALRLSAEVVDPNGDVYVLIPQAVVDAVATRNQAVVEAALTEPLRSAYDAVKSARTKLPHELTEAELAGALRPVMFHDGVWYLRKEPAHAAAKQALALAGQVLVGADAHNPEGPAEVYFGKAVVGCCGTDNRSVWRNNTSWPYATLISTFTPANSGSSQWCTNVLWRECTWQLIGPSTALASAHCFSPGGSPIGPFRWGTSPDGQDNLCNPIPAGYPQAYQNYSAYLPSEWFWFGDVDEWDFATIDFRGHAIPQPGYVAGWQGWMVASTSQIQNTVYYHFGVPKTDFNDNPYADWPQIRGHWSPYAYPSSVGPYWIDYPGDCSPGDSGSAIWQYIASGYRVTGITRKGVPPNYCMARRLDNYFATFIQATTEY
ncbi:MAG: hypothetical protein AMXMBFR22_32220 [Phycisphaerae bacterium]